MSDMRVLLRRRRVIIDQIKPATVAEEQIRQTMLDCIAQLESALVVALQIERQMVDGWALLDHLQLAHAAQVRERQAQPQDLDETAEFRIDPADLVSDAEPAALRLVRRVAE